MRVLFVKLTSMGDLIHALPALTDAQRNIPSISFDWVIDKNFSEVATWHPAVNNVFRTAHRSWKKNPWQSFRNGELGTFIRDLRQEKYDLVIDGQTNLKSALTMLLTRGVRCGSDKNSAREWIAHFAYQRQYAIPREMHAIKRLRILFSEILDYPFVDAQPDYGIAENNFIKPNFDLPFPYVVFVHNASWQSKLWPERHWQQLIKFASDENLNVLLPWGNQAEKIRAEHLNEGNKNTYVLPFCSLSEHAWILRNSQGAVCSDTGLSHLAAALDVPAITLYGSTSTKLIGTTGANQLHAVSSFPCTLCYKHDCKFEGKQQEEALCLSELTPQYVWQRFSAVACRLGSNAKQTQTKPA